MALRPPSEECSLAERCPGDQEHLGLFHPCPAVAGTAEHGVGALSI